MRSSLKGFLIDYIWVSRVLQRIRKPLTQLSASRINRWLYRNYRQVSPLCLVDKSSHSGHLDTESQGLLPNHDEFRNGSKTPFTKGPAEFFPLPDKQWHTLHDAQEVSGIDTTRPEFQNAADPAQVFLALDRQ